LLAVLSPSGADACRLSVGGSKCVLAGPPAPEYQSLIIRMRDAVTRGAPLQTGTILPRNKYNILLLADYYGLPRVKDGWVYMEVERNVYRVDFRTYRVLELVTDQTAANW
jgi:hypothetical protein